MRKGAPHVTIDPEYVEIFDEVAKHLETHLLPRPSRSGLMNKAAHLWVETLKVERPDLGPLIDRIQQRFDALRRTENTQRKNVVPIQTKVATGTRRP
jgi:hypothetical protein